jgi:hypothetical protein
MPYESDPIAAKLNDLVGSREAYAWLMWFDELPPAEQALLAIWELEQEVYNGGFFQYFLNSSGNRAPILLNILQTIGANEAASTVSHAVSLLGSDIPWNDEIKRFPIVWSLPDEIKDKLSLLDRALYEQMDELNSLLFQYLSKHRDEIDVSAEFWAQATVR